MEPDVLILLDLSGSMSCRPSDPPSCNAAPGTFPTGSTKIEIAIRAIFNILDANRDGTIDGNDETKLGIRMGYMRFYNCGSMQPWNSWTTGCVTLQTPIPSTDPPPFSSPSQYSDIYGQVSAESVGGYTPLGGMLYTAKMYLDYHKSSDSGAGCR